MSEPTQDQVIEDLKQKLAVAQEEAAKHADTVKRQSAQISSLRENIGTVKDLPEEVAADVRERMAAGLSREIAIERALAQHSHNKARHAGLSNEAKKRVSELVEDEGVPVAEAITRAQHEENLAKAKAAAATETKPGKAK